MAAMLRIAGLMSDQGMASWWSLYAEVVRMDIVPAVRERYALPQTCRDMAGTGTQVQKIPRPRVWAGGVRGEIDYLRPQARRISY